MCCILTDPRSAARRSRAAPGPAQRCRPGRGSPANVQGPTASRCHKTRRVYPDLSRSAARHRGPCGSIAGRTPRPTEQSPGLPPASLSGDLGTLPQTPVQSSGPGLPSVTAQPARVSILCTRGSAKKPPSATKSRREFWFPTASIIGLAVILLVSFRPKYSRYWLHWPSRSRHSKPWSTARTAPR